VSWTGNGLRPLDRLVTRAIRDKAGRVVRTQVTARVGHNLLVVSVLSPRMPP
jgi:hypothetical protein